MSISAHSISEAPVAAQADAKKNGRDSPPHKRTIVAASDAVAHPEAR
jgi:hypothetical protein